MAWTTPADFTNLEVVTFTKLNTQLRDNMRELWHPVGYTEFTALVTTTTHTEAAPLDIVSAGAITLAAVPTKIEWYFPLLYVVNGSPVINGVSLWDASTDIGRVFYGLASATHWQPVKGERVLTPTAASHTYKLRAWVGSGGNTTIDAGVGGVGVLVPGFIRVWQKGGA